MKNIIKHNRFLDKIEAYIPGKYNSSNKTVRKVIKLS